jgi:hypothetical protein
MVDRPSRAISGDQCLCRACGQYFNSTYAFDKHRVGPCRQLSEPASEARRCRTEDEMRAAGMALSAKGLWISAPMPKEGSSGSVAAEQA